MEDIDKLLISEEFEYYVTAMLWLRLLNVKYKQDLTQLTRDKKTVLKDTKDDSFSITQPIYAYLTSLGSVVDKLGKRTKLSVPTLPTEFIGDFGGYAHRQVGLVTHTSFEEIPTLGITGDTIMEALETDTPDDTHPNDNLVGWCTKSSTMHQEVRNRLESFDIEVNRFKANCDAARFHKLYLMDISNTINN